MNSRPVDDLLIRDHEIPTIPPVVARVMQTIESSTSSARDLGEVVAVDPALTTRILRVANSAYYGFPKEISTVTTAIIILGFVTVRGIALSVSLLNLELDPALKGRFSNRELWEHSVGTAIAARRIAEITVPALKELAFSAGLLHDLGKALLAYHHGRKFSKALEISVNEGIDLCEAELQVFEFDHADLGGTVARRWNFPDELTGSIENHHRAEVLAENTPLESIVHLANTAAHLTENPAEEMDLSAFAPEALRRLGLDAGRLEAAMPGIAENIGKATDFMNLDLVSDRPRSSDDGFRV